MNTITQNAPYGVQNANTFEESLDILPLPSNPFDDLVVPTTTWTTTIQPMTQQQRIGRLGWQLTAVTQARQAVKSALKLRKGISHEDF